MPKFVCRNPDGTTQFDINSRIAKVNGRFLLPNSNGEFETGINAEVCDVWFYCTSPREYFMYPPPTVNVSGSKINWNWGTGYSQSVIPPNNIFMVVYGTY